ncbi:Na+/H+ antiporter subunit E [Actinopolyspora saharensis]|uniref:Na+/H+ ion antiporter subunit n=1 Tax=Actinopolyspora saharensis TaxID=995062 RepID=A0A1H0YWP1_9ACTN|nr:Na+/H+ antiporter subunit E [Actinopolyspora saharensis]SDQ19530.1 Na+/H+ ion antiporter subunit [Actinopolyspora saharensis]
MTALRRIRRLAALVLTFADQLVRANFEVTRTVVTPGTVEAAVLALDLETDNPWLITTLANLVSLTPGTLTLDVAEDRGSIYVHVLATRPLEERREDLRRMQRRLLEAVG